MVPKPLYQKLEAEEPNHRPADFQPLPLGSEGHVQAGVRKAAIGAGGGKAKRQPPQLRMESRALLALDSAESLLTAMDECIDALCEARHGDAQGFDDLMLVRLNGRVWHSER